MTKSRYLHGILCFLALATTVSATEIQGTVIVISEGFVDVSSDATGLPNVDDKAEIVVPIPGLEDVALVASGKISEATNEMIRMRIERAPGKVVVGQRVRISSANPRKRTAVHSSSPKSSTASQSSSSRTIHIQILRRFSSTESLMAAVGFSTDSRTLLTCSDGVRFWDVETGTLIKHVSFPELTEQAAISSNLKTILTGAERGFMALWDADSGAMLRKFVGHTSALQSVALSPNGRVAASSAGMVDWQPLPPGTSAETPNQFLPIVGDGGARLWDAETGRLLHVLGEPQLICHSVCFSPNGLYLLTACNDQTMRLWDVATGQEVVRYIEDEPLGITNAYVSHDGNQLLSISQGPPEPLAGTPPPPGVVHQSGIARVDENQAAHRIRLWDVASGKVAFNLVGHQHEVWGAAFSPDGKIIVTGSVDRTIRFWDATTGSEIVKFGIENEYPEHFAFSPNGQFAATSTSDGSEIAIWSITRQ